MKQTIEQEIKVLRERSRDIRSFNIGKRAGEAGHHCRSANGSYLNGFYAGALLFQEKRRQEAQKEVQS